jgi:hypothetical protein
MKKIFALILASSLGLVALSSTAALGQNLTSNIYTKLPATATQGSFKYTFNSMDCKKTTLGGSYLNTKADGVYCVVSTTAKNISNRTEYVGDSDIYLIDTQGNQYEHDSGVSLYLEGTFFLDKVSPGNQKKGYLVYDVPKSAKIQKILLDGGLFGESVEVPILTASTPSSSASTKSSGSKMPNVVGKILQAAQDQLQALGSYNLTQKDATAQNRIQVLDRNWKVCKQTPAAGSALNSKTAVTLWSVKLSESCPK